MRKVITIAGSDTSGGAGLQADLRIFAKYNLYGMSVITTIVTMNPNDWSHSVFPIPNEAVDKQLDTALYAVGADVIKTGMLPTVDIIHLVIQRFEKIKGQIPLVIDPVMVCKGTKPLFPEHAEVIKNELIKYATITTPNLFEAAQLVNKDRLLSLVEAQDAAKVIVERGAKNVVIKGVGSFIDKNRADDLFYDGKNFTLLEGEKINTSYTHGLGCTFAAHIASNICLGHSVKDSAIKAKKAIDKALRHAFQLKGDHGTIAFDKGFDQS